MSPEDKRIIYTNWDGKLCVVRPCKEWFESGRTLQQLIEKDVPQGTIYEILSSEDDLPIDRYFRDAWEKNKDKVVVNIEKAQGIHLEILRQERNEKLKTLDVESIKALGVKDLVKVAEVEETKQQLRDMPTVAVVEMKSLSLKELKEYKPEVLTNE